jgi:hypothetical protein
MERAGDGPENRLRSSAANEVVRWRGARAVGFVTLPPGRLRDPALPVLRPVCEELADGPVRSPGLTSAARRPESIVSAMPSTPHAERREAGVTCALKRRTRATLRQAWRTRQRRAALRPPLLSQMGRHELGMIRARSAAESEDAWLDETLSRSFPRKRESSAFFAWLWVPAFAGTSG